ncbi:MAG: hypothetical protein M1330_02445 [Armatimonadetes bacterium]|nr:hypothetical protein [Armatimonadota bacterium]
MADNENLELWTCSERRLDPACRLTLPKIAIDTYGTNLVLAGGSNQAILGFSEMQWRKLESQLSGLSLSPTTISLQRLLSLRFTVKCDLSNRIKLPNSLLSFSGITINEDAMLLVMPDRFEIWNRIPDLHYLQSSVAHNFTPGSEVPEELLALASSSVAVSESSVGTG